MKVSKLVKKKNSLYEVVCENKTLTVDEATVLKYKLFEGKDITDELEILEYDLERKYYNQALRYQFRYNKSEQEVINYLLDKELSFLMASKIVEELKSKGLINDLTLATNIASSLARLGNGPLLIQLKLKNHLFKEPIIAEAIESISEEDVKEGINKLYKKGLKQYAKHPKQALKLKEYFYRHGYPYMPKFDD